MTSPRDSAGGAVGFLKGAMDEYDRSGDADKAWSAGLAGLADGIAEGIKGGLGLTGAVRAAGLAAKAVVHNPAVRSMPRLHDALAKVASAMGLEACFGRGTSILLADGTSKPVERLAVGDAVLSRDEWAVQDPSPWDDSIRVRRTLSLLVRQ